jgi:2-methylcitrate dehydratase PrpD
MEKISGRQLITSIIVGYDVMLRIGSATRLMMERGFHTTGVIGPFGSVAAACKAHGADLDTAVNALGIAASECGGISEYARSGGSVKRLHAGFAAQAGVKAAFLAGLGLTGPATAIEGERGFCQAYADKYFIEDITEGLGSEFKILDVAIKPYCCCFAQHAVIDATSLIMAKNRVNPDDIAEVFVRQKHREALAISAIVEPTDIVSAQFSGRFGLALRMIKGGNQFTDYSEANLKNPQILALVKKVKWIIDDELEKMPPESNVAKVTIKMKNGEVYEERVDYSKGTVQNPMTKAEIRDKFRGLASTVLPEARVNKIIKAVETLEDLDDVGKLSSLLVAKAD